MGRAGDEVWRDAVLASCVGDLKRVVTNVKTLGTWGEKWLGNLLEEIMTPGQFERNVEVTAVGLISVRDKL